MLFIVLLLHSKEWEPDGKQQSLNVDGLKNIINMRPNTRQNKLNVGIWDQKLFSLKKIYIIGALMNL